jgi:multisubunit Na+/H+ antiporter MnhE subunit
MAKHKHLTRWLAWWVLMMALWVMVDDSLQFDELLAGAGAAAIAALAAEVITSQAGIGASQRGNGQPASTQPASTQPGNRPSRPRAAWSVAAQALRLPGEVARDTVTVFGALARTLATGRQPDSGYAEIPVRYGDDTQAGETRRVLLTGARSLAPNTFVLGLDRERDVMVVHQLVRPGEKR